MQNIVLRPIDEQALEFLKMEDGIYKNILYNRDYQGNVYTESSVLFKDENIHFAYSEYRIRRGVKYFLKKSSRQGFTFNTKTNKLQVWFGKTIQNIPMLHEATAAICYNNWMNNSYWGFITKGLLEKILAKKITNNQDLAKAIMKIYRIKGSHSLFNEAVLKGYFTKDKLLTGVSCAKNFDHFLEFHLENQSRYNNDLFDMERQAIILNRKIDYTWSEKRIKSEHDQWTKDLMAIEAENLPDETVDTDKFNGLFPDNWELLNTQKRVYIEGKAMSHCVYTNYWPSIKSGQYLAFHVSLNGEEATLGIQLSTHRWAIHQLYTKYNAHVSSQMRTHVENVLYPLNDGDKSQRLLCGDTQYEQLLPYW